MSEPGIPPVLAEVEAQPGRAKWRWGMHMLLLAGYVLGVGLAGALIKPEGGKNKGPAMPDDVASLAAMCALEIGLFLLVFGIAWLFSRAKPEELFLKWRGGARPVLWGIAYSIGLRFVIMIVVVAVAAPLYFWK